MSSVDTRNNAPDATFDAQGEQRACEWCGEAYTPNRAVQRFCRPSCRVALWNASHPRISIGPVKLLPGDPTPTVEQLEAAGYRVRGKKEGGR